MVNKWLVVFSATFAISGCASTSEIMDTGNGTYMISGSAMNIRGGSVKAREMAYDDATAYCSGRAPGTHAVILGAADNVTYSSSFAGAANSQGAYVGGGTNAHDRVDLHFRCGK